MFHVYIVRCADGTLYTGYARDLTKRLHVHNSGRGARYTSGRGPVTIAYSEQVESVSAALRREHEIKGWTKSRKEKLVATGKC